MAQPETVIVRIAGWPDDVDAATTLLQHYAAYLVSGQRHAAGICLSEYHEELADLSHVWSLPRGVLLLAFRGQQPAGCVAIKRRADWHPPACEMKRLWVEESARGQGLGHLLIAAAEKWSSDNGASMLLLDTLPAVMPEAVRLYRSLGFTTTERHNENETAGLVFMQKMLC